MWYIYVLESLKNKRRYVGITNNLKRRFTEHNSEKFSDTFTSKNRPHRLIYYEAYLEKQDAQTAELFYKSGYGREILKGKLKKYLSPK